MKQLNICGFEDGSIDQVILGNLVHRMKHIIFLNPSYEIPPPPPIFDLIIADYQNVHGMSGGDYFNLHAELYKDTPIIMASSEPAYWKGTKLYERDDTYLLQKPYTGTKLEPLFETIYKSIIRKQRERIIG